MRITTTKLLLKDFVIPPGSPGEDDNKASAIPFAIELPPEAAGRRFISTMKLMLNNDNKGWLGMSWTAHDQLMGAGIALSGLEPPKGVLNKEFYDRLHFEHGIDGMNISGKMHHYPFPLTAVGTIPEGSQTHWLVAVARGNDRGGLFGRKSKGKIGFGGGGFLQIDLF